MRNQRRDEDGLLFRHGQDLESLREDRGGHEGWGRVAERKIVEVNIKAVIDGEDFTIE
jgi:hypothetical protein